MRQSLEPQAKLHDYRCLRGFYVQNRKYVDYK